MCRRFFASYLAKAKSRAEVGNSDLPPPPHAGYAGIATRARNGLISCGARR